MWRLQVTILIVFALLVSRDVCPALALMPARAHVDRGYTLLAQARRASQADQQQALLTAAVAAFKQAYRMFGHTTKVHALLGAAQAYLLMLTPPPRLPFFWPATPLQRAEKSLQQAMFLSPDNGAAALLLGLVYQRQASAGQRPHRGMLQRSQTALTQAASAGIPLRLAARPDHPPAVPRPLSPVDDTLLALRYLDARGTGRSDDLLVAYRAVDAEAVCFGVVVIEKKPYPLIADATTGAMATGPVLVEVTLVPQPHAPPELAAVVPRGPGLVAERFRWHGSGFVHVGGGVVEAGTQPSSQAVIPSFTRPSRPQAQGLRTE